MTLTRCITALHARGYSLRACLIALVPITLLPILLLGWWLAARTTASERATIERQAEQEVRGITALIDRELNNARNVLTVLATSRHLQDGDIEAFYHKATEVARQLNTQITLRDPYLDEQIMNTAVAWGGPHLRGIAAERSEVDKMFVDSKAAVVTDVFFGPVVKQHLVAVVVPVIRDGTMAYTLTVGIPTTRFADIIQSTQIPDQWSVSIVDHRNVIVARSDKHSEYTGTKVQNDFLKTASASGVHWWTYRRSELTGWYTIAGIPEDVITAPFNRAVAIYSGTGGLLLIVAMIFLYQIGGGLSQTIGALGIDRKPTREEFRVLFESAPYGVVVADSNDHIVLANEHLEQNFGYTRDELIGHSMATLLPTSGSQTAQEASRTNPPGSGMFGQRKDGSKFPIEISLNPITTPGGTFVMAAVVDITARKHAEEKLWATVAQRDDLRRRFIQAQEDERLRLAHELHDQTGQSLAAVMLGMKSFEAMVDARGRDHLRLLSEQLEQMGKALHHVAWELRPASIDELGLASALANYISEWGVQVGVQVDFHCGNSDLDDLTDEVRTTVYRVVQEALTNIAKHAQDATAISVVIHRSAAMFQLTIEDNGGGFDSSSSTGANGRRIGGPLGLAGMRERLVLIGGEFEVESSIGRGTTIFARIPLEQERLIA